ncbi:MAG: hypothetical protein HY859_17720 [Caulobacterales bacterium]|nr:hypothetical protein [Caulobacterales bacterium]
MKVLLLSIAALSAATAIGATALASDAAPAASPPAAVPAPVVAPEATKDPNARVCKTTPVIGTRVPSRVCMTRAEWEQRSRQDKQDLESAQRSGLATCGTKPCV